MMQFQISNRDLTFLKDSRIQRKQKLESNQKQNGEKNCAQSMWRERRDWKWEEVRDMATDRKASRMN